MIRHGQQNLRLQGAFAPTVHGDEKVGTHGWALDWAQRVERYWSRRGYTVKTWLEQEKYIDTARKAPWYVRSDMINGYPKDHPINA